MTEATCPVCNGTGGMALTEIEKVSSAWHDKDSRPCTNCGAQYMFGTPRGTVRTRPDGTPCTHQYESQTVGRCLTEYTCIHCGDRYQIDSGD